MVALKAPSGKPMLEFQGLGFRFRVTFSLTVAHLKHADSTASFHGQTVAMAPSHGSCKKRTRAQYDAHLRLNGLGFTS